MTPAPPPVIYALRVMKALKLDQLLTDSILDQALIAKSRWIASSSS